MEDMTRDPNSGNPIRLTDNSPKEEDDFQLAEQVNRPLTAEEIQAKIEEMGGE